MNWLLINLITAFLPILIRIIVFILSGEINFINIINPFDYVIVGLVLGVNNINELMHFPKSKESWTIPFMRISWIEIILFSLTFAYLTYIYEFNKIDIIDNRIKFASMFLGITSISISYIISLKQKKNE